MYSGVGNPFLVQYLETGGHPRRKTKDLEIMLKEKWVVETGGISPRKGLFNASLKMFEQL